MSSASVREGEVFAGKYRVERILGEGGYGVVFAARNLELDQVVAIKLLKHRNDGITSERFFREARAASKLRGDGIVRVFAVDELPSGELYMVMEHLEGHDLRHEVATSGPLAISDAVDCILQTCDVIGRAHAIGIIHRDIKPANLFTVDRGGRRVIKVLDFGIARSLDPVDPTLTESAVLMGSPLYMAPEQVAHGRSVDERADVWALGATLFELLAGRPPFRGKTIFELLDQVQSRAPASLRELRPEVPPGLEEIIHRCLEKDRESRYPDIGSLVAALASFAGPLDASRTMTAARPIEAAPSSTLPVVPSPPAPAFLPAHAPAPAPLDLTRVAPAQPPRSSLRPLAYVFGGAALGLAVVAVVTLSRAARGEGDDALPAEATAATWAPAQSDEAPPPSPPIATTTMTVSPSAIALPADAVATPPAGARARPPHGGTASRTATPPPASSASTRTGAIPDDRQ